MATKYIFVTGGVVSSLGKGITAASLGRLLKSRGLKVSMQKFDPYINFDPGTMNPFQHGEVFVTDDGCETDLDIGHYERFIDENLTYNSNVTAGKIYWSVISNERRGDYLGGTVQVIPHITNEIKNCIYKEADNNKVDVVIVEIGGTVGDIESLPFLEAIRQIRGEKGEENTLYVHVTLVPFLAKAGELKTKPTQHSVKELRSIGIQPDIIVCRSEKEVGLDLREKIALFCNVKAHDVIENLDASTLYEVPLMLAKQEFDLKACKHLNIVPNEPDLTEWDNMVKKIKSYKEEVKIALVGKYIKLQDAYLSVAEALGHGGIANDTRVNIEWIEAQDINEETAEKYLSHVDGILVPGGFGDRGIEGKIVTAGFARKNRIPYFGICLGMQMAVVEIARNVLNYKGANSTEFNQKTEFPVIDLMPDQQYIDEKGGTMRLGQYKCVLAQDCYCKKAYNADVISERHRHRYEFNNKYIKEFEACRVKIAGINPDRNLVEIIELPDHPWFVGVQFHPEFKSRPNRPHPLFAGFIEAALKYKKSKE
ncbi:MAG TPA: CTP synthase [Clostridia bacterium]|nr:CTP synthase [Clostridia bacterium]